MMKLQYNPRFVIYARCNGRSPEEQLQVDSDRWSIGEAFGFMSWLTRHFDEWSNLTGVDRADIARPDNTRRFTKWLEERYPDG